MGRPARNPPSKKYPSIKTGRLVPLQMKNANRITSACANKNPRRGCTRLKRIAIKEFPKAPKVKIMPVSLKESPRTLARKLGVSGCARYMEKIAKARTPIRMTKRWILISFGVELQGHEYRWVV